MKEHAHRAGTPAVCKKDTEKCVRGSTRTHANKVFKCQLRISRAKYGPEVPPRDLICVHARAHTLSLSASLSRSLEWLECQLNLAL